jgi:hypothetical protein
MSDLPPGINANGFTYVAPNNAPQFTPLTPGQHGVSIAAATSLTIPTGATFATVIVSGAAAKYTTDGTTTPTATIGEPVVAGGTVSLAGATEVANFKIFGTGATIDVEYFK